MYSLDTLKNLVKTGVTVNNVCKLAIYFVCYDDLEIKVPRKMVNFHLDIKIYLIYFQSGQVPVAVCIDIHFVVLLDSQPHIISALEYISYSDKKANSSNKEFMNVSRQQTLNKMDSGYMYCRPPYSTMYSAAQKLSAKKGKRHFVLYISCIFTFS